MIVSGEDDEEDEYEEQEQQQPQTQHLTSTPPAGIVQYPPALASTGAASSNPASFSPRLSPPAINTSFTSSLFSFPAPSGSPRPPSVLSASSTPTTAGTVARSARPPRPASATPTALSAQQKQVRTQSSLTFQCATRLSLSHTNATSSNVSSVRDGLMVVLSGAQEAAANVRVANETARRLMDLMRQLDARMKPVKGTIAAAAGPVDDSEQHALP